MTREYSTDLADHLPSAPEDVPRSPLADLRHTQLGLLAPFLRSPTSPVVLAGTVGDCLVAQARRYRDPWFWAD